MKENVCGLLLKKIASLITLSLSSFLLITSVFSVGCQENVDDEEIESVYNFKDLDEFYLKSKFGDRASIILKTGEGLFVDYYYFDAIKIEHGILLLKDRKSMLFIPEDNIINNDKNKPVDYFNVSDSEMSRF